MAAMEVQSVLPEGLLSLLPLPRADVAAAHLERPKKRHQVAKACQHCAVSHLSCSEHRPCERCVKKGLDCEERPRKRRNLGRANETSRSVRGDDDLEDDGFLEDSPLPIRRDRARKSKRRAANQPDEEYLPDVDNHEPQDDLERADHFHHHSHSHSHSHSHHSHFHPVASQSSLPLQSLLNASVSPTSVSPRTNNSDSSDDASGNDLASLVSAALEEEEQSLAESRRSSMSIDAMTIAPLSNPMMLPMMSQAPSMMPYPYQMPFLQMGDYGMMPFAMFQMQVRFHGQPLAPVTAPLMSTVRDLVSAVFNRLVLERLIQATDRISVTAVLANQHVTLEDQFASFPVTMLGLTDPSVVLEISKATV